MKVQIYIQYYKVKKINKQNKKEPTINSWDDTKKQNKTIVHPQHGLTDI